ncbi:isoprenylcysteine carboxylmethyltransferase family protein [Vibrio sp. DW001]|uniref:methyltransferase family protein n=1 Tax=Vibrio sp. DW001 TaxID=2912315 RepID=UPI0023B0DA32|nr:isoprenylcysteine carboxylmethyltransferase family protein [Vibrio sp. DW001]WED28163.1 isoprenylcysteine carboxylmethyltransferase family protein [Vibrio sp. DW001]
MKVLELKVPPVFVFLVCLCLMYWFHSLSALFTIGVPISNVVLAICFVGAGYFGLSGIYEFKKAKTSVHPVDINKTTSVVDTGVYKLTRNPMYFGLLLLLFGFGYWLQDLSSLAVCVLFVMYMNRFQIGPEERHLTSKFGKGYTDYQNKVRRWI